MVQAADQLEGRTKIKAPWGIGDFTVFTIGQKKERLHNFVKTLGYLSMSEPVLSIFRAWDP